MVEIGDADDAYRAGFDAGYAAAPDATGLRAALERLVALGNDDGSAPYFAWAEAWEQARAALAGVGVPAAPAEGLDVEVLAHKLVPSGSTLRTRSGPSALPPSTPALRPAAAHNKEQI